MRLAPREAQVPEWRVAAELLTPHTLDPWIDLLANDSPGTGASFASDTVRLCATGESAPSCTATSITVTG